MGHFSNADIERVISKEAEMAAGQDVETITPDKLPEAQEPAPEKAAPESIFTEDEKRKAHEAAEAERKARWDALQQAKRDVELMAWEDAVNMDANSLMQTSVQRLGNDAERITRRNMKQCVTEHIQTKCYEDLKFARQALHPRKTMIHCFQYIQRRAHEFAMQEMKDNGIDSTTVESYGCDIPDGLCYQWAEDYFWDLEAPENKDPKETEFKPQPYIPSPASKSKKGKQKKAKEKPEKPKEAPSESVKQEAAGQFSLEQMMAPEMRKAS